MVLILGHTSIVILRHWHLRKRRLEFSLSASFVLHPCWHFRVFRLTRVTFIIVQISPLGLFRSLLGILCHKFRNRLSFLKSILGLYYSMGSYLFFVFALNYYNIWLLVWAWSHRSLVGPWFNIHRITFLFGVNNLLLSIDLLLSCFLVYWLWAIYLLLSWKGPRRWTN